VKGIDSFWHGVECYYKLWPKNKLDDGYLSRDPPKVLKT